MIAGVADTHVWYVFGDPRLSQPARFAFERAATERRKIAVSVISMAEIVYLMEKNRLSASAYADLQAALRDPEHVLEESPVTVEIIDTMLYSASRSRRVWSRMASILAFFSLSAPARLTA
jgi:PIN domain nuclease of toxin-antitoxin system